MTEDTTKDASSQTTNTGASSQTKAGLPKLEDSPAFKDASEQALGGAPTNPFRSVGMAPDATPDKADKEHDPMIDGLSPELIASRDLVQRFTREMAELIRPVRDTLSLVSSLVTEIKADPLAMEEVETAGININRVEKILTKLSKLES